MRLLLSCLALALVFSGAAGAAAPFYSAASVVNAVNFMPPPFAPNSIVTIFGSGMAHPGPGRSFDGVSGPLPTMLDDTRLYIDNIPAELVYVSDTQINFLVPANQSSGATKIRLSVNGVSGPEVTVSVLDVAPALFSVLSGYAIAAHVDNSLVTPDAPAHAGEIIVIYASGLGKVLPGRSNCCAAAILRLADLRVSLDGAVVSPDRILYAGITPYSVALYQINIALPDTLVLPNGSDPEIRVAIGDQSSPPGLKLAIR